MHGEWIAISHQQSTGRVELSEEDWTVVSEENPIVLSQRELLRHRLRIDFRGRVSFWIAGNCERRGLVRWEEDDVSKEGIITPRGSSDSELWSALDDGNWESDVLEVVSTDHIIRHQFVISHSSYCNRQTTHYVRVAFLSGEEFALPPLSTNRMLRSIGEGEIADVADLKTIDLAQHTLQPEALMVLLERPEWGRLRSINLSDVLGDWESLCDVLISAWHTDELTSWDLAGCPQAQRLLEHHGEKALRHLDLRHSDITNLDSIRQPHQLRTLYLEGTNVVIDNRFDGLTALSVSETLDCELPSTLTQLSCQQWQQEWGFPALTKLELKTGQAPWEGLSQLQSISITGEVDWQEVLRCCPNVEHIHWKKASVSESDWSTWQELRNGSGPRSLRLEDCAAVFDSSCLLGYSDLEMLAVDCAGHDMHKGLPSSLRFLQLGNFDGSVKELFALTQLQHLGLSGSVNWEDFELANGLLSLQSLTLRDCELELGRFLSAHALISLMALDAGHCSLKELNINRPPPRLRMSLNVSEEVLRELHQGDWISGVCHPRPAPWSQWKESME